MDYPVGVMSFEKLSDDVDGAIDIKQLENWIMEHDASRIIPTPGGQAMPMREKLDDLPTAEQLIQMDAVERDTSSPHPNRRHSGVKSSKAVQKYLGKRSAPNTLRAIRAACRLFACFSSALIASNPSHYFVAPISVPQHVTSTDHPCPLFDPKSSSIRSPA